MVDFMLLNAPYSGEIGLTEPCLKEMKKFKIIALYGAVQFSGQLKKIIGQLEDAGIKVISSQPERTSEKYQILGCDVSMQNLKLEIEPDAFLYIGDGLFHPLSLVLAQKDVKDFVPVIRYNPKTGQHFLMSIEDVAKSLKKYKSSLMKFLSSDTIGVIVTTKPGQQQYMASKALKEKYPDKNFYYFIENTIEFSKFEDFPFVEVWVNTACPRIGFDDNANIPFSMINLMDALLAEEKLSEESFLTKPALKK